MHFFLLNQPAQLVVVKLAHIALGINNSGQLAQEVVFIVSGQDSIAQILINLN